nr:MAG TPA: hypothetical protein [Caudoviricetes sp.]
MNITLFRYNIQTLSTKFDYLIIVLIIPINITI